jgi:hypothetical protein
MAVDAGIEGTNLGAAGRLVAEIGEGGVPGQQRDGDAIFEGEFGLERVLRVGVHQVGEVGDRGANVDCLDLFRLESVALDEIEDTIHRAMGAAAIWEAFHPEAAGENQQRLADPVGLEAQILAMLDMGQGVAQPLVVGADHQPVHAVGAIQRVEAGVDAGAGKRGGDDSGLGGEAGMYRLGHGAELRHEAGGHAGRDRDGVGGLLGVEPEQARTGGGGADRADRGGGVPAAVAMRRVHALADAAEDLKAGNIGVEAGPA